MEPSRTDKPPWDEQSCRRCLTLVRCVLLLGLFLGGVIGGRRMWFEARSLDNANDWLSMTGSGYYTLAGVAIGSLLGGVIGLVTASLYTQVFGPDHYEDWKHSQMNEKQHRP